MWKGEWHTNPPCSEAAVQRLIESATAELPPEYVAYLRESNGGGGDIGVDPGLLYFWRAEEVAENNDGYEVQQNVPGFYAFGSSGGGEMFAFDTRGAKPWPIVIIPFIPMDAKEAIQIAPDFGALKRSFGVRFDEPPEEIQLDDCGHPMEPDSSGSRDA